MLLSDDNVDQMLQLFYDYLNNIFDICIPLKYHRFSSFPPWFTTELKTLVFAKRKAHLNYIRDKTDKNYSYFSTLRAECKICSKTCYNNFISNTEKAILENPKYFDKYVSSTRRDHSISTHMFYKGESGETPYEISNLLAKHFKSVYTLPTTQYPDSPFNLNLDVNLNKISVNRNDIFMIIKYLNINKGRDQMVHLPSLSPVVFQLLNHY